MASSNSRGVRFAVPSIMTSESRLADPDLVRIVQECPRPDVEGELHQGHLVLLDAVEAKAVGIGVGPNRRKGHRWYGAFGRFHRPIEGRGKGIHRRNLHPGGGTHQARPDPPGIRKRFGSFGCQFDLAPGHEGGEDEGFVLDVGVVDPPDVV